jgi:hypothetical protein
MERQHCPPSLRNIQPTKVLFRRQRCASKRPDHARRRSLAADLINPLAHQRHGEACAVSIRDSLFLVP